MSLTTRCLQAWNRAVANGCPTHAATTAATWIEPALPALLASAGDRDPVELWSAALKRWLERKDGRDIALRFFCLDLPDLLSRAPRSEPRRLHPVYTPPAALPEHDPDATQAGLASVREVLQRVRPRETA